MIRERLVKALKALANTHRLDILETLQSKHGKLNGPIEEARIFTTADEAMCYVDEIMKHLNMAQSSASQHLKELYNAGVLRRHKEAQRVYYSIDHQLLDDVIEDLIRFSSPTKKVSWMFDGIRNELLEQAMEYLYLHDAAYTQEKCA